MPQTEAALQRLLDTSLEGIITIDADDVLIYVNARFAQMLGYEVGALDGRPLYDLLFPEDAEHARARRAERRQGTQEQYEARLRRKDGTECWAVASVSVVRDGDGEDEANPYAGTFSMFTDISARKEAEAALVASNAHLQSALDREALVNRIGQAARRVSDPQIILATALEALGLALGADRCYYVTYDLEKDHGQIGPDWHRPGLDSVSGQYRMSDYPYNRDENYQAGETSVVEDVLTDSSPGAARSAALGLRSLVRVPLQQGPVMTALSAAMAGGPRQWTRDEVALVETVAAQTRAAVESARAAQRERAFLRDVLASVTDGKLLLSSSPAQLPPPGSPFGEPVALTPTAGLYDLRRRAQEAAREAGLTEERQYDLLTAASEAGMNAIVHAGGGLAQVGRDESGTVQVRVEDHGAGIAVEDLPRAALARGWSTKATLGHGLKMMLETVDRLYLLTGPTGTTVVLEQDRTPPIPPWLSV